MARGNLRIYLGAAPGVGKTYAMLNEGWRRHQRGTDVVIGLYETHGRPSTAAQVRDLEVVPRRVLRYRDATFEEMDVDAILARKPQVALVDELAHTNVPGSRNAKRWQDVEELLDAGIDVVSTLNIQHLESVNDVVERITGVKQQETMPDEMVRQAEQVELVDMTPEALRRRLAHGNVYPAERIDASLANYFRPGNLAALREIALLWVADRVEENLQQYLEDHGIEGTWETRERVVVALTGAPGGDVLIRRASRMARRVKGDLLGVHVRPTDGLATRASELLVPSQRRGTSAARASAEGGFDVVQVLGPVARAQGVEGAAGILGPQPPRIEGGDPAVGLVGQAQRELGHLPRRQRAQQRVDGGVDRVDVIRLVVGWRERDARLQLLGEGEGARVPEGEVAEHVGHCPAVGDQPAQVVVRQAGDQRTKALALVVVLLCEGTVGSRHAAHPTRRPAPPLERKAGAGFPRRTPGRAAPRAALTPAPG